MLSGQTLSMADCDVVLQPTRRSLASLKSIYRGTLKLAASRPEAFHHAEVARSLEQELIHAVVTCLTGGDTAIEDAVTVRKRCGQARIMARFDEHLAIYPQEPLSVPQIANELGISQSTLDRICKAFTGMTPHAYSTAKRMHAARAHLLEPGITVQTIASIAKMFGFYEPGRFAVRYKALFGESPRSTLREKSKLARQ